jgi:Putative beta-barrel porin 2
MGAMLPTSLRGQALVTEPTVEQQPSETTPLTPDTAPFTRLSPDDLGLRAGSAPLPLGFDVPRRVQVTAAVLGGYDDNVNLLPAGSASWFVAPSAAISYGFGSSRLALSLLAGGSLTYYLEHPGGRDYDPNLHLELLVAYIVNSRLTLTFSTYASYQSQPDFSTDLSVNRILGNYFRTADQLSASYRFTPRFSSVTSYSFSALEYDSSAASLNNRLEQSFGEELRYLLFPTTSVTAGYRFGFTDYANAASNSTTQTFSAGADQSFSPRFTVLVRAGLQLRSSENGHDRTAPYGEGTIRYAIAAGNQTGFIDWTNRYSVEEADSPTASGRETFRTNLALTYPFTARIAATFTLSYLHGDNGGAGVGPNGTGTASSENVFDIAPSLRYAVMPHVTLSIGYRYSDIDSGSNGSTAPGILGMPVTRNRYFAGVNITF